MKSILLAQGRTAEIYAWGETQIIKLFFPGWPRGHAEREQQISKMVAEEGIPSPEVGEVVEQDRRYGVIYERLSGTSMLWEVQQIPWRIFTFARLLAGLHAQMHSITLSELPSQREALLHRINKLTNFSSQTRGEILESLQQLPEGNALCHGDFHPDNVMITGKGPFVIDWPDAKRGHPLADVARTKLLLTMTGSPPDRQLPWYVEGLRTWFYNLYINQYFRLRPESQQELDEWMIPIAAARIAEQVPGEEEMLVEYVGQRQGED